MSCLHAAGAALRVARREMGGPDSWVDIVNSHTWLAGGAAPGDDTNLLYEGRGIEESEWTRVNLIEAYGTLAPRTDAAFVRQPSDRVLLRRVVSQSRLQIQDSRCSRAPIEVSYPTKSIAPRLGYRKDSDWYNTGRLMEAPRLGIECLGSRATGDERVGRDSVSEVSCTRLDVDLGGPDEESWGVFAGERYSIHGAGALMEVGFVASGSDAEDEHWSVIALSERY